MLYKTRNAALTLENKKQGLLTTNTSCPEMSVARKPPKLTGVKFTSKSKDTCEQTPHLLKTSETQKLTLQLKTGQLMFGGGGKRSCSPSSLSCHDHGLASVGFISPSPSQ